MIEILTVESGLKRVEAARVLIPGFEHFELFATPFWNPELKEVEDDKWVVTEAKTGTRLGPDVSYESIDLAVKCTIAWLKTRGITPPIMQRAIERMLSDNTSTTVEA